MSTVSQITCSWGNIKNRHQSCMWVLSLITQRESAGYFIKFLMVIKTMLSNKFTIIGQKVGFA